jgi:hypothetical protein
MTSPSNGNQAKINNAQHISNINLLYDYPDWFFLVVSDVSATYTAAIIKDVLQLQNLKLY